MKHLLPYGNHADYSIAILARKSAMDLPLMLRHITPYFHDKDIVIFDLAENDVKKTPIKLVREYIDELLPELNGLYTKYLYVCDSTYFKELTGLKKVTSAYGYVYDCKKEGFEHFKVVLGINPKTLYYDPSLKDKIKQGISALNDHKVDAYIPVGTGVINSASYPSTNKSIKQQLESLHKYEILTCDIEAFSLSHLHAKIGTIAFAWDRHNGTAFTVDYKESISSTALKYHGLPIINVAVRKLLKDFFLSILNKYAEPS